MKNLCLVSFYGSKPMHLAELITRCQKEVSAALGDGFRPYELSQVHATLVGMERLSGSDSYNYNLAEYRERFVPMDFLGLLKFIRLSGNFPLQIQIAGFEKRDYPFTSRGQSPYERSFSIQGDKVVLMGWPIRGEPRRHAPNSAIELIQEARIYPNSLDGIRRALQTFNILHAYHRSLTDVDNDFYFRIGLLDTSSVEPTAMQEMEATMREYLRLEEPLVVDLMVPDLYIASYEDETLTPNSTQFWSMGDPEMSSDFIWKLYE